MPHSIYSRRLLTGLAAVALAVPLAMSPGPIATASLAAPASAADTPAQQLGTGTHTVTTFDTAHRDLGLVGQRLTPARAGRTVTHQVLAAHDSITVVRTAAHPIGRDSVTTASFVVTYHGFSPEQQGAFQAAVDTWASILSGSTPITVDASLASLPPDVLGGTETPDEWSGGSLPPGVRYPQALAHELDPTVPVTDPDVTIVFADPLDVPEVPGLAWYFGTDGHTPSNDVDFETTTLHELGHGLGFAGSFDADDPYTYNPAGVCGAGHGCYGYFGYDPAPIPDIYDTFAVTSATNQYLTQGISGAGQNPAYFNNSTQLHAALTSDDVCLSGPSAVGGANGVRPKLYTPSTWEPGSSSSHLDEATYMPGGTPTADALMAPALPAGTAVHWPGNIVIGALEDMGWSTTTPSAPQAVTVTSGFNSATVQWTPPSDAGNAAVTGYRTVAYRVSVPVAVADVPYFATSATITGLTMGTLYHVRVTAMSDLGPGRTTARFDVIPLPFAAYYNSHGSSGGEYGAHISGPTPVTGGWEDVYAGGTMFYSASTGAHGAAGASFLAFERQGGFAVMGFPTSEPSVLPGNHGTMIAFQNGGIVSSTLGTFALRHVFTHWLELGSDASFIRVPTSDEAPHGNHGNLATFQGARMYYTTAFGAHEVHGPILTEWGRLGGSGGGMGYPRTDVAVTPGYSTARYSKFAGGYIYWAASLGAHRVTGHTLTFYGSRGGSAGRYGLPTSNPTPADSTHVRQSFQHGYIVVNTSTWATTGSLG